MVALGRALRQRGHAVQLAAPATFETFIREHDLEPILLPGDIETLSRQLVDEAGGNPFRNMSVMMREGLRIGAEVFDTLSAHIPQSRAVVYSFVFIGGGHALARQANVPDIAALFYPVFHPSRTPSLTNPMFPAGTSRAYNQFTHWLFDTSFWQSNRIGYGQLRRRRPGLPAHLPYPFRPGYPHMPPRLYTFSPHIIARPPEWGDHDHLTGFWQLPAPADYTPPPALAKFLSDGPPPVYVGFGSMVSRDMPKIAELVAEALVIAGQRGVLLSGWGGLTTSAPPGVLHILDSAPHDWLFPRMAAVVHHGGLGTTAAGLRAGVPSIIVPFTADQPFWGRTVYNAGVGPRPIPRRQLTARKLAAAIQQATTDSTMRQRAAELGDWLVKEDGATEAARIIENYLNA